MSSIMKPQFYLIFPLLLLTFGCKTYKEQPDLVDIRRFTPPAERGDARGQYLLGQAYASHWLYPQASLWYRKAALQGQPDAMFALGQNHLAGLGVAKNPIEAYAWFDIAASQNHILAKNARESLVARMTHSEIEAGTRRAAAIIAEIPPARLIYALSKASNTPAENENNRPAASKPAYSQPPTVKTASQAPETPAKSLRYGSTSTKGAMNQANLDDEQAKP
jgi:TPR repeat protein